MNVSELMDILQGHPQDADVVIVYETYAERDIDEVWSCDGKVYIEAENN